MKERSVFRRIYGVFLASTLAMLAVSAILAVVQFRARERVDLASLSAAYLRRQAADLAARWSPALAEDLARSFALEIYAAPRADAASGSAVPWSSSGDPELTGLAEGLRARGPGTGQAGGRKPYAYVHDEAGFFLVRGRPFLNARLLQRFAVGLLIVLAGVSAASYFSVRTILRPLARLDRGVAALRGGDLSYKVAVSGADEFAALAASFNSMADTIAGQMEAKQQLLLDVSHELRSPLTRIGILAEFVDDEQLRRNLRDEVAELDGKISLLLLSSRLDSPYGKPAVRPVPLLPLLEDLTERTGGAPPGIVLDASCRDASVDADPELLRTILRNLLENALKYSSPDAEPVAISFAEEKGSNAAGGPPRGSLEGGGTTIISVSDRGRGVEPGAEEELFRPFARGGGARGRGAAPLTSAAPASVTVFDGTAPDPGGAEAAAETGEPPGFGVGLYLCRRMAEAHGGTVSLAPRSGGGTVAAVVLPRRPA